MGNRIQHAKCIAIGSLSMAIALCFISIPQKMLLSDDWLHLSGFILPFLVGLIAGGLLGHSYCRIKALNRQLAQRVETLENLLPICLHCKKIQIESDENPELIQWIPVERYIVEKTTSKLTHSICPDCAKEHYAEYIDED